MKVKDLLVESEEIKIEPGIHSGGELSSNGNKNANFGVFQGNRRVGYVENTWVDSETQEWMFFHCDSAQIGTDFKTKEQAIAALKKLIADASALKDSR